MAISLNIILLFQLCCLAFLTFPFGICTASSEIPCIPSEREALLRFKLHLIDPSNRLSSWSASNANCCDWAGVVCGNVTAHVLQLHLNTSPPAYGGYHSIVEYHKAYAEYERSMFGGEINASLLDLKHLNHLDLSGNDFGGTQIPSFLGAMTSLTYLNLSDAGFDGKIPHQIGNLSNLLYLDLSYAAHGATPYQIGNLTNLLRLGLGSYSFSYIHFLVPKWIFGLRKLVSLQLRGNNIQGPIPDGIQNLTLLENLDLSFNSFSSSIPDRLYRLHHLKFLNLGSNSLRGTISDVLGNLTSLVKLDLSRNQLEGRIPTSLGNLCNLREIGFSLLKLNQQVNEILEILTPCVSHGLTRLEIQSSHLSGNLTDQIGVFKNIVKLDFSNNSIHGALPRSFGKLSSLSYLDLSKNQFNGNPFEILRSLSQLLYLSMGDNLFKGVVKEDDLANLTSLRRFHASGNNLTLEVGPNWYPGFQVSSLAMSSWQLGPNFPSWIQSQKDLDSLDMSNTGISDAIPTWLWETFSDDESFLNLSHNHIHGELASTLKKPISINSVDLSSNHLCGKLPYLSGDVYWLDLSSNLFSGSMNDFLCKKIDKPMQLEFLNLASNNLSRHIPDCWRMWPNLADVNLQSNQFIGNLPPSMVSLAWLEFLHIRNNTLFGIFPHILKKTSRLISLDLGENKLSGIIPSWVGEKLLYLKILRL